MKQPSDDLIIFRTCANLPEAQIIKLQLENEGLHPEIKDEHMQNIASHLSSLLGNITLLLPEDEVEKANEILAVNHSSDDESEEEPEQASAQVDQKALYAKRAAFFGVLLIPFLPTLYSLVLSFQCVFSPQALSVKGRKDLTLAFVTNFFAILVIAFLVWSGTFLNQIQIP